MTYARLDVEESPLSFHRWAEAPPPSMPLPENHGPNATISTNRVEGYSLESGVGSRI